MFTLVKRIYLIFSFSLRAYNNNQSLIYVILILSKFLLIPFIYLNLSKQNKLNILKTNQKLLNIKEFPAFPNMYA